MSGTADRNRENPIEAPGPVDRALDRDRDDKMDVLEGGADRDATQRAARTTDQARTDRDEIAVPVAEERLDVGKRQVELGEVQVRKTVTEEQVSVPVELTREEVRVEQRDVSDRPVQAGDQLFQEGTIRVPVRGEEAIVTKEAVVTGEVVIDKERLVERQDVTDTVRKERVEVDERTAGQGRTSGTTAETPAQAPRRTQEQAAMPPQAPRRGATAMPAETTSRAQPTSGSTARQAPATGRGQVQVDMQVVGSDQDAVGRVKEVRAGDFLVDRRMQRDVYVPLEAVQTVTGDQVVLSIPAYEVDDQGWPNP